MRHLMWSTQERLPILRGHAQVWKLLFFHLTCSHMLNRSFRNLIWNWKQWKALILVQDTRNDTRQGSMSWMTWMLMEHDANVWNKTIKTFKIIMKIRNAETATRSCAKARLGQPPSGIMLDPTPVVQTGIIVHLKIIHVNL